MKANEIISVAVIAACVLAPFFAAAREYFVATDGDDAADGSAAKPWRTIQRAADVASAGDTVTIRGGVYREWVKPANAGRADAPITYRAAKGEKVGVVGTNWSRGWTIEDCEVSGASCTGITLGKYGDEFDNIGPNARHYHNTIMRAVSNGLDRVGHHIVRRCRVTDCGQAGICGPLGAVFSQIEDCEISYCHWRKPFTGDEMAGIKIHGAVDFTIKCSRIHHCGSIGGIWLDWMAQGRRSCPLM